MSFIPCDPTKNLCKVLQSIASTFSVNQTALAASQAYVTEKITPVKDELTKTIENVVYALVFLVIVFVLIPMICLTVFMGHYWGVKSMYIGAAILFLLIVFIGIAYFVGNSLLTEIVNEVNTRYNSFIDNVDTTSTLLLLGNAATAYNANL